MILVFLPNSFSKYKVDIISERHPSMVTSKLYYHDFDGDRKSERVEAQTNTLGNASLLYYDSNGDFGDQINFSSKWPTKNREIWFSDMDSDNEKELFMVTQLADSAFLSIINPFNGKDFLVYEKFIDTISTFNNENKFSVNTSQEHNEPNKNDNEVIFSIRTGFAANPRHLYKYDFANDSILKSPHLTNSTSLLKALDIDKDGENEFLLLNHASGNRIDSIYSHRSDSSTWLQLLDDDLQFLFEPIEFNAIGGVQTLCFENGNNVKLLSYFRSYQKSKISPQVSVLDIKGNILNQIKLQQTNKEHFRKLDDSRFILTDRTNNAVNIYNTDLKLLRKFPLLSCNNIFTFNISNNQAKEWLVLHEDLTNCSIYDEDFKYPTTFKVANNEMQVPNVGIRFLDNNAKQLFIQKGNFVDYITYSKNPLYYLRYGIYAGIYLGVLGLVLLVSKGQSLREEKKRAIEKQISELQIKTIKNQVDPHFVFNAINTISEMTLMDNKLEADKFIGQFSHFMRDTLQHSDKITTTLREELDYTENFIILQQVRFNHRFDYQIEVNKHVKLESKIPKHAIFTYVENAIKHGLALKDNGMLKIKANYVENRLLLSVEDNGLGIHVSNTPKKNSTGHGLRIMEDIFSLYTKLNRKKISQTLKELKDKRGNPKGVKVDIVIGNK